ncbi:50S ribosomal protein L31 [candidate division TM6 bacterium RIFCSPHIGHO2_12_FULL_36_22]|nr:MAG: 50S ribosomal protein L31 [candidate division TM6 bacterium RIFCSPHIGHO2_12_FULL_36_22]
MKKDIHPNLNEVSVVCTCGAEIKTRSTATEIHSTLCSSCHPFYTGTQKFVDTAGRIEKFQRKYAAKPAPKKAAPKPAEPKVEKKEEPKKDILVKTTKKA